MTYSIALIIKLVIAATLAVIIGNGSVVLFNKLPVKWFEDWKGEEGDERVLPDKLLRSIEEGRQRIPSTPWKLGFTAFFLITGIFMSFREPVQYLVGAIVVMGVVLEMAIADSLYRVVPDQFSIVLALSAVGFVGLYDEWWEPFAGAGFGLVLSLLVYGLGRLLFRKNAIGGADIKFYVSMGLVVGRRGIIAIFLMTSILTAIQAVVVSFRNRGIVDSEREEMQVAMLPSAFVATAIYLVFMWGILDLMMM